MRAKVNNTIPVIRKGLGGTPPPNLLRSIDYAAPGGMQACGGISQKMVGLATKGWHN